MTKYNWKEMSTVECDELVAKEVMGFSYYCGFNATADIVVAWRVLRVIKGKLFSVRQSFERHLQRAISERMNLDSGFHPAEIILLVEPEDICLAALRAVGVDV